MKALKGTWLAVAELTELSDKVCRETGTIPGYAKSLKVITCDAILAAHEGLFPFPLPAHMEAARREITELFSSPGSLVLKRKIDTWSPWFGSYMPSGVLEKAGLQYLRGMIAMAKANHHGDRAEWYGPPSKRIEHWKEAQEAFRLGRVAISAAPSTLTLSEGAALVRLELALTINWIACAGAQVDDGAPRDEVEKFLADVDAVGTYRNLLAENNFLWLAAWNGLHVSSMLRYPDDEMLFFYKILLKNDPGYCDFDYDPGEIGSINAEPALAYFRSRFAHLHVPIKGPKS